MKNNNFGHRVTLVAVALCLSACAHTPAPSATGANAGPNANAGNAMNAASMANAWDNVPPDVQVACRGVGAASVEGRLADAAELARQCLASHSVPVSSRVAVLQQLALLESALHHANAALDAQRAAIDLTPAPTDLQLFSLAKLYENDRRYEDGLATLDRIRAAHETKQDLDSTFGAPYYLVLGRLLSDTGHHQQAIDALSKGISLAPALAGSYALRAAEREAVGDMAGARDDYVQFARWAPEPAIDAALQTKLSQLHIDPAAERQHPFGAANPLREYAEQSLKTAQHSLTTASTSQEKAKAYGDISVYLDDTNRHEEALSAIDKAIALAPNDTHLQQSKITTLVDLNRVDDAITLAAPLLSQMHGELAGAAEPNSVYKKYVEAMGSSAWAYLLKGDWTHTIALLSDLARGSDPFDQDYLASLYLYARARSDGAAPTDAYFEDYIRRNQQPLFGNYRRWLLLYMQGRMSIDQVYTQVIIIPDGAALENALAETWFMAAAYERFVKHDDAAARGYVGRLNDLKPYGTNEWNMATRGAV
ncbi:hypothetical protein AAHK20_19075 [Trinickia sp. YCB016]